MPKPIENGRNPLENVFWGCAQHSDSCCAGHESECCVYPDYRYLGKDFRERERLKRMKARWVKRLEKMPLLQRQALLAALAQVDNGVGPHRQGWR